MTLQASEEKRSESNSSTVSLVTLRKFWDYKVRYTKAFEINWRAACLGLLVYTISGNGFFISGFKTLRHPAVLQAVKIT